MISICIPTYEMNGKGAEYLSESFNMIYAQTYVDLEVVISDHSSDDTIKNVCEEYKDLLNINYVKNTYKKGNSSANINNAIKNAKGEIIKILFQDDFLYDENSLNTQVQSLGNNMWLVTACCHYNDDEMYKPFYPQYHDQIQYGQNTISSPSVLMFRNKDVIEFDEELIWLMDVDYYKRLYDKFGDPKICNIITVVNREHKNQVSNTLATFERQQQEYNYIVEKYAK